MKLENVGQALKSYFSGKPIWQALMPLDIVFLGVPLLLNLLTLCTVNIGFLSSLTMYLLIVGVLLAFANAHYMFLMGAFGAAGAVPADLSDQSTGQATATICPAVR